MRIISGRFGGRRLVAFKADHIRPTTDRIKEVIFNKLQMVIEDAKVLDLFSGTGSLALEALSRGAQHVDAVEKHPKSVDIIKKNMDLLGITKDEMSVYRKDVFSFLKQPVEKGYDIILIDPPFTEVLADKVLEALGQSSLAQFPCIIFIEGGKGEMLRDAYGVIKRKDLKNYGDKSLGIYYIEPI
jgi:16S rRNA (guanine966-N2)-methyltransferase